MLYNQQLPEAVRICLQKHSVKIRPRNIQQKLHWHFIPYDNLCNFPEQGQPFIQRFSDAMGYMLRNPAFLFKLIISQLDSFIIRWIKVETYVRAQLNYRYVPRVTGGAKLKYMQRNKIFTVLFVTHYLVFYVNKYLNIINGTVSPKLLTLIPVVSTPAPVFQTDFPKSSNLKIGMAVADNF